MNSENVISNIYFLFINLQSLKSLMWLAMATCFMDTNHSFEDFSIDDVCHMFYVFQNSHLQ